MCRRIPFEQSPDYTAMRSSAKRMLTSRSPERSRLSVESSWVPAGQIPLGSAGVDAIMWAQLATAFASQKHL